jgi:hypothetical protein
VKRRIRVNKGFQMRMDIATAKGIDKVEFDNLMTFFFSDFPPSFGAQPMFNAFHYYGDIREVVIPAKRDRGGRRFGIARFAHVTDARRLEAELASLIIGRDKISVNLSRYHRSHNYRRQDDWKQGRMEKGVNCSIEGRKGEGHRLRSLSHKENRVLNSPKQVEKSYAQVVRQDPVEKQGPGEQRVLLSYEAEQADLVRLQKAFVGVVTQPSMAYNIQDAFHRQGYFGVKITPLGSTLTLLEGQEEGEVQALMEDAKEWLDQWFVEIRPWSPCDIDTERTIWLRVYGVPSHAWNDSFFSHLVSHWGNYINADEGTKKKITMDVARLMIRTSSQRVVDDFIDVKVNGKIFHLRVIEDSYGPMRIMLPHKENLNGRDIEGESEDEDEEEDDEHLLGEEEIDVMHHKEGVKDNGVVLTLVEYSNNGPNNLTTPVLEINKEVSEGLASNSNNNNMRGRIRRMGGQINQIVSLWRQRLVRPRRVE